MGKADEPSGHGNLVDGHSALIPGSAPMRSPAHPELRQVAIRKCLYDATSSAWVGQAIALVGEKWGPIDYTKATRALWRLLVLHGKVIQSLPPEPMARQRRPPARWNRPGILLHETELAKWLVLEVFRMPHPAGWDVPPASPRTEGRSHRLTEREIDDERRIMAAIQRTWGGADKAHVTRVLWRVLHIRRDHIGALDPDPAQPRRALPTGPQLVKSRAYIHDFSRWLAAVLDMRRLSRKG